MVVLELCKGPGGGGACTQEAEGGGHREFEVSLVYSASSRTARTVTWQTPVSGKKKVV